MGMRRITTLPRLGLPEVPEVGWHRTTRAEAPRPRRRIDDRFILLHLQAGLQFRACNGTNHLLSAGQGLIIRPGWPHGTGHTPLTRGTAWWLHLRRPQAGQSFLGLTLRETRAVIQGLEAPAHPVVTPAPGLADAFSDLVQAVDRADGGLRRLALRRSVLAIVAAFAEAGTSVRARKTDTRIADLLLGAVADPVAFRHPAALAVRAGCSLSRLRARVKEATGMALGDWLLRARIDRAMRDLIDHPRRSITAIALDLGFSSSQYFATVFRRYAACSPRDFRALIHDPQGRRRLIRLGLIDGPGPARQPRHDAT